MEKKQEYKSKSRILIMLLINLQLSTIFTKKTKKLWLKYWYETQISQVFHEFIPLSHENWESHQICSKLILNRTEGPYFSSISNSFPQVYGNIQQSKQDIVGMGGGVKLQIFGKNPSSSFNFALRLKNFCLYIIGFIFHS